MENKKLLVATRNKGKLVEIKAKLSGTPFGIVDLKDPQGQLGDFEVEETAMTFEGNAIIKAMTYGKRSQCIVLADDAGLEVDALDGRPGVFSARYAPGTDEDRYRKLLDELKDVAKEERTTRFRCVIAIYDPVFFIPSLGKTAAQLTLEEKNQISHRGRALQKAKDILLKEFV